MTFLWPDDAVGACSLLPLLVRALLWLLRRRKKRRCATRSLASCKEALGARSAWRRHVPPVLLLLALAALLLAAARPAAVIACRRSSRPSCWPWTSRAACAPTDVLPNRLVAAQEAAKAFVAELPRSVRIGVVSFAGTAAVVQAPTLSRDDVIAAIDRFQLQRGTAIGSGIVLSLATLFPDAGIDLSQITGQRTMPPGAGRQAEAARSRRCPPGSYGSAAIILLTDGQRTTGPDPLEAAKMAADRGVRVYTVGIGTKDGETIGFEGWSMRVRLDEDTLKNVASSPAPTTSTPAPRADLKKVYQALSTRLVVEKKETEISALFAALGALLVVLAAGLSVWWFGRRCLTGAGGPAKACVVHCAAARCPL